MKEARRSEAAPKGWPAALLMFHLGMWRERLRDALAKVAEGRPYPPAPKNIDEVNDAELAGAIGIPLSDAAARSDHLLAEIIDLYGRLGERPFEWYVARTTTEAVLRNSFTHPRAHLYEYLRENGDLDGAHQLMAEAVREMRASSAPPLAMGNVLYNLACARAQLGRIEEAITSLDEALVLRPDLKPLAAADIDLVNLRENQRFAELVES